MKSVGEPHAARGPQVGQHWFRLTIELEEGDLSLVER